jgi:amidase
VELHDLTALEQARAIRRQEVSSDELARHYLARAHSLNEAVGAFATMTDDLALSQAAEADRLVRESPDADRLPVLHGVVVPVKDLNEVRGVRTRFGSLTVDVVSSVDDDVVAELRRGNTVMTGKTTTPEFGFPAYTESDIGPYARTPWDLTRGAGGSSGGAAAAVAAGLAPVAQGSDGGGSIRIPASVCGLVGIKPSRGLISNGPMPDGLGRLGVQGALARTVADAAALLGVMSGRDDAYVAALRDPAPLLIGRYHQPVIADTDVHPESLAAFEDVSALLESLGHHVVDIEVPLPLDAVAHFELVWAAGAAGVPVPAGLEGDLRPLTRWLRERGRALLPGELEAALGLMAAHADRALAETAHLDIVLTPTLAGLPAEVGAIRDDEDPAADFEAQKRFTPYTSPYNITGQPAVSLPVHWTGEDDTSGAGSEGGLPVGVQLVSRPMHESVLLGLAAQIEAARPWAHRHPEVW